MWTALDDRGYSSHPASGYGQFKGDVRCAKVRAQNNVEKGAKGKMMNAELKKTVQERHAALLTERDQFVVSANQKLGEYAGRLAELEALFAQLSETDDPANVAGALPKLVNPSKTQ